MTPVLTAAALGLLGGAWHLLTLLWRTRLLARGRAGAALWAAPLGWAGPAAAVGVVLAWVPAQAWAVLPGLVLARLVLVRPLARRLDPGPTPRSSP